MLGVAITKYLLKMFRSQNCRFINKIWYTIGFIVIQDQENCNIDTHDFTSIEIEEIFTNYVGLLQYHTASIIFSDY